MNEQFYVYWNCSASKRKDPAAGLAMFSEREEAEEYAKKIREDNAYGLVVVIRGVTVSVLEALAS